MQTETRPGCSKLHPQLYHCSCKCSIAIFNFNMQSYAKWMSDTIHPCTTPCSSQTMVLPKSWSLQTYDTEIGLWVDDIQSTVSGGYWPRMDSPWRELKTAYGLEAADRWVSKLQAIRAAASVPGGASGVNVMSPAGDKGSPFTTESPTCYRCGNYHSLPIIRPPILLTTLSIKWGGGLY